MLDRVDSNPPEIKINTAEEQFDETVLRLENRDKYKNLVLALKNLKYETIEERNKGNIKPEHALFIAKNADDLMWSTTLSIDSRGLSQKSFAKKMDRAISKFIDNINSTPKNLRRLRMACWILAGIAIGLICALSFLGVGVLGSLIKSIVIWKKSEAAALIGAAFTTCTGTLLGYRYSLSNPDNSTAEKVIYTLAGLAIGLAIGQLLIGAMLWYELAINIVDALMKASSLALAGASGILVSCTFFAGAAGSKQNQNSTKPIETAGKEVVQELRKLTSEHAMSLARKEKNKRANSLFYGATSQEQRRQFGLPKKSFRPSP